MAVEAGSLLQEQYRAASSLIGSGAYPFSDEAAISGVSRRDPLVDKVCRGGHSSPLRDNVFVFNHRIGSYRDDGKVSEPWQLPDFARCGQSVHDGHLHVHQHQVKGRTPDHIEGLRAILRTVTLTPKS
jgi:hypothetical protein